MLQIILAYSIYSTACIIGIPRSLKCCTKNTQTVISLYVLCFDRNGQIFSYCTRRPTSTSDLKSLRYPVKYLVVNYSDETNEMRLAPFPTLQTIGSRCVADTQFSRIFPFHFPSLNHGMGSIAPLSISGSSPPYRIPLSYMSPPTPPAPPMPWGMSGLCSTMRSRPVLYFIPPLTLAWTFSYEDCQL